MEKKMMKKIKQYKTDNPIDLNRNRIIKDPAIINYLFGLGVPLYVIRERNNTDNYFAIAGVEVTEYLSKWGERFGE